jgi:hypothetical protein
MSVSRGCQPRRRLQFPQTSNYTPHRPRCVQFFVTGGGADALAAYALVDNVHRLPLPPRMAAVWKFHLGVCPNSPYICPGLGTKAANVRENK